MRASVRIGKTTAAMLLLAAVVAGCSAGSSRGPATSAARPPVAPALRGQALRELESAYASPDAVVRAHAMEVLHELALPDAAGPILAALRDREAIVRFAAATAAGELRLAEAREPLLAMINDKDANVRVAAIFAMHRLGDTRFSRTLEQTLTDPDVNVRGNTAMLLGRLGERSAVRILVPRLRAEREVRVKLQIAEALWMLGDENGLKMLVAASISRYPDDQMIAFTALAGPHDQRVAGHIVSGLSSDYAEVALVAARALGMVGRADGMQVAMKYVTAGDPRQRLLAARALGAIGRTDAQQALAGLLKDKSADVRLSAAAAILALR